MSASTPTLTAVRAGDDCNAPGSTSARACAAKQPAADASAAAPRIRHVSADINVPLIHKDIPQRCLQQVETSGNENCTTCFFFHAHIVHQTHTARQGTTRAHQDMNYQHTINATVFVFQSKRLPNDEPPKSKNKQAVQQEAVHKATSTQCAMQIGHHKGICRPCASLASP